MIDSEEAMPAKEGKSDYGDRAVKGDDGDTTTKISRPGTVEVTPKFGPWMVVARKGKNWSS